MTRHLFFAIALGLCVASFSAPSIAQTFPVTPVLVNGGTNERINIVCLSEGYTAAEMSKFITDVAAATADLFATPPYAEYMTHFNVYAIEVPSNESGTDHPNTASDCPGGLETFYRDTYFNSTFDASGIHRLLVVQSSSTVYQVLQNNFPEWDVVFIVVNHTMYGGSGGSFATFSLHTSAGEIAIHELGHSFADLADEYEYGGVSGYEAPNATQMTIRELIKWNDWIEPTTPVPTPETPGYSAVVGLFEGAVYNPVGWYRPKLSCKMRALSVPFCEVCSEQTIITVYEILNTIESFDPPGPIVPVYKSELKQFSVSTLKPNPNTIVTTWYVDGAPVATATDNYQFNATEHAIGNHLLEAVSRDTTATVRSDPYDRLESTVNWSVSVISTPTGIDDNTGFRQSSSLAQNVPNPFNPNTTIQFHLSAETRVTLVVYDAAGRAVTTLVSGIRSAGNHTTEWNGLNDSGEPASSGIYFYRLKTGNKTQVKKMLLLK
jgi:hypothetical protein